MKTGVIAILGALFLPCMSFAGDELEYESRGFERGASELLQTMDAEVRDSMDRLGARQAQVKAAGSGGQLGANARDYRKEIQTLDFELILEDIGTFDGKAEGNHYVRFGVVRRGAPYFPEHMEDIRDTVSVPALRNVGFDPEGRPETARKRPVQVLRISGREIDAAIQRLDQTANRYSPCWAPGILEEDCPFALVLRLRSKGWIWDDDVLVRSVDLAQFVGLVKDHAGILRADVDRGQRDTTTLVFETGASKQGYTRNHYSVPIVTRLTGIGAHGSARIVVGAYRYPALVDTYARITVRAVP